MRSFKTCAVGTWLTFCLLAGVAASVAQPINLDAPLRAGELIVFPEIKDENTFYYIVDKPRLATDERGRPQFSFLRYVENVRSGADEEEAREGEGGGIVHCVVSLSVTDDQRRDAERELRRLKPGAVLRGPVVFRSGTFGLVSSFTDTEGNLSEQVVGLGNAPLLDGEKAAVSMQLTKLGAKILWESFQTPTPDISFSFEMDIEGYRSPKQASIRANFDRIYEHQAFAAGIATPYLAGEIKGAFDDLYEEKVIEVEQIGDDEQLGSLLTTAYNKVMEMMFQPIGGSGTPSLASLASGAQGQPSVLDRASTLLRQSRSEARQENEGIRRRNRERREAAAERESAEAAGEREESASERADALEQDAERAERRATQLREAAANLEESDPESAATFREGAEGATNQANTFRRMAEEARAEASAAESEAEDEDEDTEAADEELEEEVDVPDFAVVATYEMKRIRQRGVININLNKYTSDSMTLRFDENIGDLSRFVGDQSTFRQVNLDDPLYRQREIVAFVDGLNAEDFGEYINFVSVQLRKRHEGGDETYDEVRIDRNNFNREGNAFKLLYGWKEDNDRRRWMQYDVQTKWSFFGGSEVDVAWNPSTSGAVNLAPPYQRREVTLEADPDMLAEAEVRSVTVSIFYELGGGEQSKRVTLNASKGELSEKIEFLLPADQYEYEYEISWRLRGNRSVSSGRQSSTEAILFVDELPEA